MRYRYRIDRITKRGRQKFARRPSIIEAYLLVAEQKAIDKIPPRQRNVEYEIVKVRT